jgi:hypothetical protein
LILGKYVSPPHDHILQDTISINSTPTVQNAISQNPKHMLLGDQTWRPNLQAHDRDLCLPTHNLPTSYSVHHSLHHRIAAASYIFKHQSNKCRIRYNKMTKRVTLVNTLTTISQFRHMSSNYFIVHYGEYIQVIQIHSRNIL